MSRRGRETGRGERKNPSHKTAEGRAVKDGREAVLLALLSHEKKQTFSNVLTKRTLDGCAEMSTAEKAFIKRLLEGVIERRIELDGRVEDLTGRSVQRLHPAVRQLLRMGLYQILYMDAVPDSAACNESVRLAKKHAPARLSGFVNGVLRNAARLEEKRRLETSAPVKAGKAEETDLSTESSVFRQEEETGLPAKPAADQVQALPPAAAAGGYGWIRLCERRYSTPGWLIRMWEEELGREETDKLLASLMEIRSVSARFCGDPDEEKREELFADLSSAGVVVEKGRWTGNSFRLHRTSDLRLLPGFREGLWTVQDESSMLAVEAAGLTGTETVYDVCAAPGGKSFLAADLLRLRRSSKGGSSAAGRVYSFDLTERKAAAIREGAKRLRLSNITVSVRDARVPVPVEEAAADVLFCDLPCSGLGVIGKKRDIKYRASLEGIESLQKLQREILENTVLYLKPGGILIYSTCTVSRRENEDNAAFIESALGLIPDDLAPFLPENIPGIRGNRLQLLPHVHGTDGFFIARFRKKPDPV